MISKLLSRGKAWLGGKSKGASGTLLSVRTRVCSEGRHDSKDEACYSHLKSAWTEDYVIETDVNRMIVANYRLTRTPTEEEAIYIPSDDFCCLSTIALAHQMPIAGVLLRWLNCLFHDLCNEADAERLPITSNHHLRSWLSLCSEEYIAWCVIVMEERAPVEDDRRGSAELYLGLMPVMKKKKKMMMTMKRPREWKYRAIPALVRLKSQHRSNAILTTSRWIQEYRLLRGLEGIHEHESHSMRVMSVYQIAVQSESEK